MFRNAGGRGPGRVSGAWLRVAAVLGMLAVPLAAAGGHRGARRGRYHLYRHRPPFPSALTPIRGGGGPGHRHRLCEPTRVGDTVSVIDGATNTVTATIPVGSAPDGVGVDPATGTVYVTNFFPNTAPCR